MTKRITFAQVAPNYIHAGKGGWEVSKNEDGTYYFPSKMPREARKEARLFLKGIRVMVRVANGQADPMEAYRKMNSDLRNASIVELGQGALLRFTDYSMGWGRTWWADAA